MLKRGRKGQVTLFVIIAMAIVGALIFLFLLKRPVKLEVPAEQNPQLFIQKCVREKTLEGVEIMLPQGGFIAPENYKLFENKKVAYLCENRGYYFPCVNQHPMYLNELRSEISNYITPKVDQCFGDLKLELYKRNAEMKIEDGAVSVDLIPGEIQVIVNKKVTITKGTQTQKFDKFEVGMVSRLYDIGNVALEIANQEASYCNFEYVGYMMLHPDFSIRKEARTDGTKIYSIKDKKTDEELFIAVRGCAIPPGI